MTAITASAASFTRATCCGFSFTFTSSPANLPGSPRSALPRKHSSVAATVSSPVFDLKSVPFTPMKSASSVHFQILKTSSPSTSFLRCAWMVPLRS